MTMPTFSTIPTLLLLLGLAFTSCESTNVDETVAADLNSTNTAVAAQAHRVQQLMSQIRQQEAVITAEKEKLDALHQQLDGAQQTLEGIKRQAQATP